MKYSDPRLVEHLASAYVLGTLTAAARRRFDRLQRDRADVRLAVAQWETRLGRLAASVPAVRPSPRVWEGIAARTRPVAQAAPAALPRGGWRPAGMALGVLGLCAGMLLSMAVVLFVPGLFFSSEQVALRTGERLPPSYVGLLTDAQGNGKLLVSSLRHGRAMTVKVIGPLALPERGRLVLWAVPASGAPFVLGDVPASGSATSMLSDTSEKLLAKVGRLAVTTETEDRPAAPGPVLYAGNCAKLW